MRSDVTVLLSSGGRRAALLDALRRGGAAAGVSVNTIVTDRSPLSAAGHLADGYELVPPVASAEFIPAMADVVRRHGVDVIVPTIDPELAVLADGRAQLEAAGATVLVSDKTTVDICSDKARSSGWLTATGFDVPRQYSFDEAADLPLDVWPLFFKPLEGSSSIGAHPVHSPAEVELATARFGAGVIEELVVGPEYTVDCWVDPAGRCGAAVPRRRLAVRAGEVAKGSTECHEAIEVTARAIAEALPGGRGPVTIQAIDTDCGPRFIEINPRFGGGYPLSHEAGAWYTAVLIAEVAGTDIDPTWFEWRGDLVMLRYDDAVFVPRHRVDELER